MNNNDENCENNNDINNIINIQIYRKNNHSKSNQIPKIELKEKNSFKFRKCKK